MQNTPNFKIVEVIWNDACSYESRHPFDYEFRPSLCKTVGFLISETDKIIVVGRGIEPEMELVEGALVIPRGWIEEIKELSGG